MLLVLILTTSTALPWAPLDTGIREWLRKGSFADILIYFLLCNANGFITVFTYFMTIFTIARHWGGFPLGLHSFLWISHPFAHSYHSLKGAFTIQKLKLSPPWHELSFHGCQHWFLLLPSCLLGPHSWNPSLISLIPWDFHPCILTLTFPGH